jgi:hypothetical protein
VETTANAVMKDRMMAFIARDPRVLHRTRAHGRNAGPAVSSPNSGVLALRGSGYCCLEAKGPTAG